MTHRDGMTLMELLVVIAIIGVLVAITLPAVQAAREAGRKTSCKNNLREIGLSLQSHHAAHGTFPSNGWGYRWLGEPAGGLGAGQPGGWIYNSLPYLEQGALHSLGSGASPQKEVELTQAMLTPLPVFHCPSRRAPLLYPYVGVFPLYNVPLPNMAAKCDYAGNGGSHVVEGIQGPAALTDAAVAAYLWPDTNEVNGIFYVRSQVAMRHVLDGTSQTYLVGEKHVSTYPHLPGPDRDRGDDQTAYIGDDIDIRRWVDESPRRDSKGHASMSFGSAHSDGCYFVLCDGSVQFVRYGIDPQVHWRMGNRHDGQPVEMGEL